MSSAPSRAEYASLLAAALPGVIRTEAENERFTALLEQLEAKSTRMTSAERRIADLLTLLIEDFEEKHYALRPAGPIEVLNELMLANNLKQKDLLDVFATPSITSEILSGKRQLTIDHIRKLSRRFHVSAEVFF